MRITMTIAEFAASFSIAKNIVGNLAPEHDMNRATLETILQGLEENDNHVSTWTVDYVNELVHQDINEAVVLRIYAVVDKYALPIVTAFMPIIGAMKALKPLFKDMVAEFKELGNKPDTASVKE